MSSEPVVNRKSLCNNRKSFYAADYKKTLLFGVGLWVRFSEVIKTLSRPRLVSKNVVLIQRNQLGATDVG